MKFVIAKNKQSHSCQSAYRKRSPTAVPSGPPINTGSFNQGIVIPSVDLVIVIIAAVIVVKKRITSKSTTEITV